MNPGPQKKKAKPTPQRAAGKTATSISLSEETLEKARQAAAADGRPLSNWIEQLIKNSIKLLIFLCLIAKLTHRPTDWSAEALAQSVATGAGWFAGGVWFCLKGGYQILASVM